MIIAEPNTAISPIWTFLNSPLGIALATALVSVGVGSIFANWLAARWQLRAKRYEWQLKVFGELQSTYWIWLKAITKEDKVLLLNAFADLQNSLGILEAFWGDIQMSSAIVDMRKEISSASVEVAEGGNSTKSLEKHNIHMRYATLVEMVAAELGMRSLLYRFRIRKYHRKNDE